MRRWLKKIFRRSKPDRENRALAEQLSQQSVPERKNGAQERAISERIRTSNIVIIEEEYAATSDASVGVQGKPGSVQIGVQGSGKHLAKRSITFISNRPQQE